MPKKRRKETAIMKKGESPQAKKGGEIATGAWKKETKNIA